MPIKYSPLGRANNVRYGSVRFATDQELENPPAEPLVVTAQQLKDTINTSAVNAFSYQGKFDPTIGTPDLRGAKTGYFYKVSKTGTYLGFEMTQGDNIYIRQDMPENDVNPDFIDLIDNTESISILNDLADVAVLNEVNRQGLVFLDGQWVNGDLVYALPELEDVSLNELTSASYSSTNSSATLVLNREHIVDTVPQSNKIMTLPSTTESGQKLKVTSIGGGTVEIRLPAGHVWSGTDSVPRSFIGSLEITFTSLYSQYDDVDANGNPIVVTIKRWSYSSSSLSERQVLATANDGVVWSNYFLNVGHVLGASSQAELDRVETAAGLATDGTYVEHTTSNFINASTSLRSADVLLDSALKTEQTARINAVANEASIRANADNAEASTRAAADNNLQTQINATNSTLSDTRDELDLVEQSVGLNDDGSVTAFTASNFLNAETTIKGMIGKLDEEAGRIEQLTVSGVLDLQDELDLTQASIGGLTAGGTFTAITGSNYIDAATTFREADELLDSALKAEETARIDAVQAEEDARVADVARIDALDATQNSRLDALEAIDPNHQAELDLIEQSVGLNADGGLTPFNGSNFLDGESTIKDMIEQLDVEAKRIEQLNLVGILNMQEELDRTQAAVGGMTAQGTFTAITGSNYIDAATDFRSADELLDSALKAEEGARIDAITAEETARIARDEELTLLISAQDAVDTAHDGRLTVLEASASSIQAELDATQAGAGLNANGSFTSTGGIQALTFYGPVPTTLKGGLDKVDLALSLINERLTNKVAILDQATPRGQIQQISNNGQLVNLIEDGTLDASSGWLWYFSTGSFGATLPNGATEIEITDLTNFSMKSIAGTTGGAGITELKCGITISGATGIRTIIDGFQVEGLFSVNGTLGAHQIIDSQLVGGVSLSGMTGFMMFKDCEFAGDITIDPTFAGVVYFFNCGFGDLTSFTNGATAAQVIIYGASGFPFASLSSVTPTGTIAMDNLTLWNFNTHISLPNALSFTGKTSELTADSLGLPDAAGFTGKASQLTGDYISLPNAATFTGNLSEMTDDIGYVTAQSAPVRSVNTLQGDVVLDGSNVDLTYAPTAYTVTNNSLDEHALRINEKLTLLNDDKANTADLKDVALSGDAADLVVAGTYTNYLPLSTAAEDHFKAIDLALASAGAVKQVNSVSPNSLGNVAISSNNIAVPVTFSAGYTAAQNSTITENFQAIDLAISLAGKVETVNGESPDGNKNVLITGEHIDHAATITAWTASDATIKGAFAGLSDKLATLNEVAYSGDYADLSNVPTAGINQGILVTSAIEPLNVLPGRHYIVAIAEDDILTINLPSSTNGYVRADGDYIRITNWGNGTLRLTEVDGESHILNGQTILDGSAGVAQLDINSRGTIHIFGFDFFPLFPQAWGVYYSSSVEFNTKGIQDGAIFKFDTATQKMVASDPISDVAYSGEDADLIMTYAPTQFTASTLTLSSYVEGIDDRLGELKDAAFILSDLAVSNFTPSTLTVEGYFSGIDTKLAGVATSQGGTFSMQVGNGSGGLVDRDWTIEADNHIVPSADASYDLGAPSFSLRKAYIDTVSINEKALTTNVDGNLTFDGSLLKAEGAPLYDAASRIQLTGGSGALLENSQTMFYGTGTHTASLPDHNGLGVGVTVLAALRGDALGSVTINAWNNSPVISDIAGSVASKVLVGRGNQVEFVWTGSEWTVKELKLTQIRGAVQFYEEVSANGVLSIGVDHRSVSDVDLTMTLPELSTLLPGDRLMVSRGINLGGVSVEPHANDVGANAILSQNGFVGSFDVSRRGDNVIFIADTDKWVTQEERLERAARVYTSSPALLADSNVFAVINNAQASCAVVLPSSSTLLAGDTMELYCMTTKEITVSPSVADSGVIFIYTGSTQNNQVVRSVPGGNSLRITWDGDKFHLENSIGSAGLLDAGTAAGNVVVLDGNAKLPAVDGSQLTGIVTGTGRFGFSKVTTSGNALVGYHHSVDTTGGAVTLNLPDITALTDGDFIRFKLATKVGVLNIQPNGADTIDGSSDTIIISVEGDSLELIADTTGNWEIV